MKKDNTTLSKKVSLRRQAAKFLDKKLMVLETHGGMGKVFELVYSDCKGVVFEKNQEKVCFLAEQRPSWRVYESDCLQAIKSGVCDGLPINFIDVDPYGDPWPVIGAILKSKIKFPKKIAFCVNDGLRKKAQLGGSWNADTLKNAARKYGNSNVYKNYLQVCRELMTEKAAHVGFNMCGWYGYYCGNNGAMTHYAALLER